jgi:hypothetical protein
MKRLFYLWILMGPLFTYGQITTPIIKARFGVDGDLRANYFNGLVQTGNDDWYNMLVADTSGKMVIDTTGVSGVVAGYTSDVSPWPKRMSSLYRGMSKPAFSIVNNRLWLDAIFIRDYHGNDTTVFTAGSDKNGMSPDYWTGGVQGIPDKNDILDMFMHLRRAGPTAADSLWFFGGLSLDNTTGNRYFDFELYQTDIYYDRASGQWYGYGPDAGHTSWTFDAAGNVLTPGDIIFSAEYQSSTLTYVEARVWVKKSDWQNIVPAAWNWSGLFDGDGAAATYGYASISPKTAGAFYTGLGSAANTWAGFFRLILQNNSMVTNYAKDQFMEFSVNLTKLGLDPVTQFGGDICGTPFNRLVVKTRSSASFTSELKDFVAPTDLFLAPRVEVTTQTPAICDTGSIAQINVSNPMSTSYYQWAAINGRIVGPTTGTTIAVDTPGTYRCFQYLQQGCVTVYAADTIQVMRIVNCEALSTNLQPLEASRIPAGILLTWSVLNNSLVDHFIIERSNDGSHFYTIGDVGMRSSHNTGAAYDYIDSSSRYGYYRIKLFQADGSSQYSAIVKVSLAGIRSSSLLVYPNPVKDFLKIEVNGQREEMMLVKIFDASGKMIRSVQTQIHRGFNIESIDMQNASPGLYHAIVMLGGELFDQKVMVVK